MNTFHTILQRSIITFIALCFVFVATYVPQSWNDIKKAEAGAATGGASEPTQIANNLQLAMTYVKTAASAAYDAVTSAASGYLQLKESTLDGIAWVLAKTIISQITNSMVKWINSGFKGSPAFVQDLQGFLLNAGDVAFGNYLKELGGPLSALCSPFKLDIRIALQLNYIKAREDKQATCTLTGVLANIDEFMDGNFEKGGWESWFRITSNPTTYTPLGSLLQAEADASVRILNTKAAEQKLLDFGNGFMSNKVCQVFDGREECYITTPGTVISEALTFQLSTGGRSLVAADEINEIIGALMGQISQKALSGAFGLLGLGGNAGYKAPGYAAGSYLDDLTTSGETQTIDPATFRNLVVSARDTEVRYLAAANDNLLALTAYSLDILNNKAARRNAAKAAADKIEIPLLGIITNNIDTLNDILDKLDGLPAIETPASAIERRNLTQQYLNLKGIHTEAQVDASIAGWEALMV